MRLKSEYWQIYNFVIYEQFTKCVRNDFIIIILIILLVTLEIWDIKVEENIKLDWILETSVFFLIIILIDIGKIFKCHYYNKLFNVPIKWYSSCSTRRLISCNLCTSTPKILHTLNWSVSFDIHMILVNFTASEIIN